MVVRGIDEKMDCDKIQPFEFNYNLVKTSVKSTKEFLKGTSESYGELTTIGTTQFIEDPIFKFNTAINVCDFGMGRGHIALQMFEQCCWIKNIVGIELHTGRFGDGSQNLRSLAKHLKTTKPDIKFIIDDEDKDTIILNAMSKTNNRKLIMENGSITEFSHHIKNSDVSFLNISFSEEFHPALKTFLLQAKKNAIIISYLSLERIVSDAEFEQINCTNQFDCGWGIGKKYQPCVYRRK